MGGSMPRKWDAAFRAFQAKIKTFARNSYYTVPGFTAADMEQELLEVLWWCVFDYDPGKGATFNTFFQTSARNRISTLKRAATAVKRGSGVDASYLEEEALVGVSDELHMCESAEATVVRRINIAEYAAEHGSTGLRQLVRTQGTGALS